jgi:hypothetical protein
MTSRTFRTAIAAENVEAVVVSGGWGGFLINRAEISSSIYYSAADFSGFGNSMFHVFAHKQEKTLLLDFDHYLNKYFSITPSGNSCIIFFFNIRPDSPLDTLKDVFAKTGENGTILSRTAAVKITGTAALHSVPLREFRFFPEPVRAPLARQGILCLRIKGSPGAQYLIDLHTLMTKQLERISTENGDE